MKCLARVNLCALLKRDGSAATIWRADPNPHSRTRRRKLGRERRSDGPLPCWDWLFGTSYLPNELPKDYGIDNPLPQTVLGQLVHPFLPPSSGAGVRPSVQSQASEPLTEEQEQRA